MAPKRGKKPAASSPKKSSARKKHTDPVEEEEEEETPALKVATPRRSRSSAKAKETEIAEVEEELEEVVTSKEKSRSSSRKTRGSAAASSTDDEPPKESKKGKGRQKRKALESDQEEEEKEEETEDTVPLPPSSPQVTKRQRKNSNASKVEEAPKRRGRQSARKGQTSKNDSDFLENEEEEISEKVVDDISTQESESDVKSPPTNRGRRGSEQKKKSEEEEVATVDENLVEAEDRIDENTKISEDIQGNIESNECSPLDPLENNEDVVMIDKVSEDIEKEKTSTGPLEDVQVDEHSLKVEENVELNLSSEQRDSQEEEDHLCDKKQDLDIATKDEADLACKNSSTPTDVDSNVLEKEEEEVVQDDNTVDESEKEKVISEGEVSSSLKDERITGDASDMQMETAEDDSTSTDSSGRLDRKLTREESSEGFEGFDMISCQTEENSNSSSDRDNEECKLGNETSETKEGEANAADIPADESAEQEGKILTTEEPMDVDDNTTVEKSNEISSPPKSRRTSRRRAQSVDDSKEEIVDMKEEEILEQEETEMPTRRGTRRTRGTVAEDKINNDKEKAPCRRSRRQKNDTNLEEIAKQEENAIKEETLEEVKHEDEVKQKGSKRGTDSEIDDKPDDTIKKPRLEEEFGEDGLKAESPSEEKELKQLEEQDSKENLKEEKIENASKGTKEEVEDVSKADKKEKHSPLKEKRDKKEKKEKKEETEPEENRVQMKSTLHMLLESQRRRASEQMKQENKKLEDNQQKDEESTKKSSSDRQSKRKSRWDNPTKVESSGKKDPSAVSEGVTSTLTSSAVPVKIITTKKDSRFEDSSNIGTKAYLEKTYDFRKFTEVVILTSSDNENDIRVLRNNSNCKIILEKDLNPDRLVQVITMQMGNYPKNVLWVYLTGIYDIAKAMSHQDCYTGNCKFTLKEFLTLDESHPPIDEVVDNITDMMKNMNKKCHEAQKVLGNDGLFIVAPPFPVILALQDSFHKHAYLHRGCRMNYSHCIASKYAKSLHVYYNMFCDVITKNACELMASYLPVGTMKDYQEAMRGQNFIVFHDVVKQKFQMKQSWIDLMLGMISDAINTDYPVEITPVKIREESTKKAQYKHGVVMGNLKYADTLKQLTKDLPVSFVDEVVQFDENGLALLEAEQKKWPANTIFIILTGVSGIAEPLQNTDCDEKECEDQLPIFVPKNQGRKDSNDENSNDEGMVSSYVDSAFEFAGNALYVLKKDSALFLAPIMPLRAIWGGETSKLSHDDLHMLFEDTSLPVFGNGKEEWIKCAQNLESKWLQTTMNFLEPDSIPFNLYSSYQEAKPEILHYITESDQLSMDQNIIGPWSSLVSDLLIDYLPSKGDGGALDIRSTDYEDIVQQADTKFAENRSYNNSYSQGYNEKESGPNSWQDYSRQTDESNKNTWQSMSEQGDHQGQDSNYRKNQKNNRYSSYDNSYDNSYDSHTQSYNYDHQNQGYDQSYQDQSYQQGQNYGSYQGMDSSYQGGYGSWMGGAHNTWGGHQGYPQGPPPPGTPGHWGQPPQWMPGHPPMWGSAPPPGPPPGPPPSWGPAVMSSWSTAPPPPPTWTSAPPPTVPTQTSVPDATQSWQTPAAAVPAPAPVQTLQPSSIPTPPTPKSNNEATTGKLASNIMIQNVSTDMKVEHAKKILEVFGELTYLKWPLDHLNKPAKFLMSCYEERGSAEKCVRVLNYLRAFGKDSEVKLVGVTSDINLDKCKPEDVNEISHVQDLLNKMKDETSVKVKENSNRIVVSNVSNLVPRKILDALFASLRANRSFKTFDPVISNEEELHYFVVGSVLNVKMLDGYRFPDKKLRVKLIGPDEDKAFEQHEKEAARHEIDLLMKKHIDTIADLTACKYINKKEVNIYTFKTVRCQNDKTCKSPGLCHDYHIWKDRRRCPILFKYSDEMCPNLDSNGKCPSKDKCSKAHSPLEVPFHLKNFRAHICSAARRTGQCNKTEKICAYLHPGTTEAFYDRQWRDLYVEGLDKSITYFAGAVMNLFKVSKQSCARVLLITPSPEFVTFLVKSMEALSFSCDQEICAIPENDKPKKAAILVGTPQAVMNWMAEEKRSKNVNLDRLKALIIDDGPAVAEFIEAHGYNFLIEFAKIKDLNKVITAENIHRQDVIAMERLRLLSNYKKIYAKDNETGKPSPPNERPPSPSRKSSKRDERESSLSSRRDRTDDRQRFSHERDNRQRYSPEGGEMKYGTNMDDENQSRKDNHTETFREQERRMDLQQQMRRQEEMKLEEERRQEEQIRQDLKMMQEREQQMRQEQEMQLGRERIKNELKEKEEALERNYKKYVTSKEDLKREHERERKLYCELPEVHPEYEEKYRVFLNQYTTHYPDRNDNDHRSKLWMLFWKELVSSMLETAYIKKRKALDEEYTRTKENDKKEIENLKRKASSIVQESCSQFQSKDQYESSNPGTSSMSTLSYTNQAPSSNYDMHSPHMSSSIQANRALSSFSMPQTGNSQLMQGTSVSVSIPQAIAALTEVCDYLGELGPALRLVMHKITSLNMDTKLTAKLFADADNAMIVKMAAGKLKEMSEKLPSPNKEKMVIASFQAMQLLQLPTAEVVEEPKKPYHGLDISKVARATLNKDPTFIIQFIKNALLYEGVTDPTQDDISSIFITITNAHYTMAKDQ